MILNFDLHVIFRCDALVARDGVDILPQAVGCDKSSGEYGSTKQPCCVLLAFVRNREDQRERAGRVARNEDRKDLRISERDRLPIGGNLIALRSGRAFPFALRSGNNVQSAADKKTFVPYVSWKYFVAPKWSEWPWVTITYRTWLGSRRRAFSPGNRTVSI